MPILSVFLWRPVAGAILLAFFPRTAAGAIKGFGLFVSLATFVVSLGLLRGWEDGAAGFQFVEQIDWIPQWGIRYALGVDGISLWLVLLTTFLTPIIFLSAWNGRPARGDRRRAAGCGYRGCVDSSGRVGGAAVAASTGSGSRAGSGKPGSRFVRS
jgi:NADH:ubiquinone oxidoreductase subunit 4 (subunit M)